jgi:hypothetical protein
VLDTLGPRSGILGQSGSGFGSGPNSAMAHEGFPRARRRNPSIAAGLSKLVSASCRSGLLRENSDRLAQALGGCREPAMCVRDLGWRPEVRLYLAVCHPSSGSIKSYLDAVGAGSSSRVRSERKDRNPAQWCASNPQPTTHAQATPAMMADCMRTCVGVVPVHRLKAFVKALTS